MDATIESQDSLQKSCIYEPPPRRRTQLVGIERLGADIMWMILESTVCIETLTPLVIASPLARMCFQQAPMSILDRNLSQAASPYEDVERAIVQLRANPHIREYDPEQVIMYGFGQRTSESWRSIPDEPYALLRGLYSTAMSLKQVENVALSKLFVLALDGAELAHPSLQRAEECLHKERDRIRKSVLGLRLYSELVGGACTYSSCAKFFTRFTRPDVEHMLMVSFVMDYPFLAQGIFAFDGRGCYDFADVEPVLQHDININMHFVTVITNVFEGHISVSLGHAQVLRRLQETRFASFCSRLAKQWLATMEAINSESPEETRARLQGVYSVN